MYSLLRNTHSTPMKLQLFHEVVETRLRSLDVLSPFRFIVAFFFQASRVCLKQLSRLCLNIDDFGGIFLLREKYTNHKSINEININKSQQ